MCGVIFRNLEFENGVNGIREVREGGKFVDVSLILAKIC